MSIFETLRERVPIEEVVRRYSEVKGNKARCVASSHQDTNPSMHLYEDRVHCYACDFHGDVTDVWAAVHGVCTPSEAALNLAREFGIELPERDPEAKRKAQERRDKEDLYLEQAKACHKALSCHKNIAEWWEGRGFDERLQERFLLGTNEAGTAATIPFWYRGRVQGLIRRNLQDNRKYLYPKAEDFPGGYRPLFIPGPVCSGAFLVEGIIDALAVAALGESAVAIGGTGISREQMRELGRMPGSMYILPDADEDGAEASRRWVRGLYPKALLCPADYGGGVSLV